MTPTHLRSTLKRLGLTQVRAADCLGISGRQMRRWCRDGATLPLWLPYALRGLEAELRRAHALPGQNGAQRPQERP